MTTSHPNGNTGSSFDDRQLDWATSATSLPGNIVLGPMGSLLLDDDEFPTLETLLPSPAVLNSGNELVTGTPEQYARVAQAIRDLMDAFNVDWTDPNYTRTPERVAKAYIDYWVSGYAKDPMAEATVFPNVSGAQDMVMVKDMHFYSLCAHHLAQIEGYAAIAYIPNDKLIGLSKLGRILEVFARRFQMQERIGAQVADTLMTLLQPKGVMVVLYNVTHGCMSSRGVKLHEASTTTSAVRGCFSDPAARAEALSLLAVKTAR